jgi:hypothetical protein
MDYARVYRSIVERGQVREPEGYYEVHHILPRCMGGGDEPENLTKLTAREHFIAHWLLVRMYPEEGKLANAFWMMSNGSKNKEHKRDYSVSSRAYAEAKELRGKNQSEIYKNLWKDPAYAEKRKCEVKEKWKDPVYRKKMLEKISERMIEKWKDPDHKKNMSEVMSERMIEKWKDPDHKKNMSEKMIEKWKDPVYAEKRKYELKEKWEDPEFRKRQSDKIKDTMGRAEFKEKFTRIMSKYRDEDIREIRRMSDEGITVREISKKMGISKNSVCAIKNGKTYWWVL